jgi:hypothetical protein
MVTLIVAKLITLPALLVGSKESQVYEFPKPSLFFLKHISHLFPMFVFHLQTGDTLRARQQMPGASANVAFNLFGIQTWRDVSSSAFAVGERNEIGLVDRHVKRNSMSEHEVFFWTYPSSVSKDIEEQIDESSSKNGA